MKIQINFASVEMPNNRESWLLSLLTLHCICQTLGSRSGLLIKYSWIYPNIEYPNSSERTKAIQNKSYVPSNVAIIDADSYTDPTTKETRYWVTTPQFQDGIPTTLLEIRDNKRNNPLISPFPSWAAQSQSTCDGPVSVYRIYIDDDCGLMWVADSGYVNSFVNPRSACPPKLLAYDLKKNDSLVLRYIFPDTVVYPNTILNTIAVSSCQSDCRKAMNFIADVSGYAIITYDPATNTSSRIFNPYCYPFPDQGYQTINGTEFVLMDGCFGLALSPECDEKSRLYFHSLASIRESWVLLSSLIDPKIVTDPVRTRNYFHHSGDIRAGQSTAEVMTDDGIMIYPVLPMNALACWNSAQPLEKKYQHIIYRIRSTTEGIFRDDENLQFISGMKLKNKKTLLITSCRLQYYINFLLSSPNTINYRVMEFDIDKLLNGTPCRFKKPHSYR